MIDIKKHFQNHWFKIVLSFSVLLMISVVVLYFPKNITRLALFGVFFLCDYYIWRLYRNWFFSQRKRLKKILISLYWMPSLFLVVSMLCVFLFGYDAFINPTVYFLSGLVLVSYILKFIFAIFLLFSESRRLMTKLTKKLGFSVDSIKISARDKIVVWIGLSTSSIFLILFIWGGLIDNNRLNVTHVSISSEKLPKSFDGFKIVQLSDIHFISWVEKSKFREVVAIINNLKPDLVVFTGDLVTFRSSEAISFVPLMKKIRAKYGVFAILGNHDYGDYINWNSDGDKQKNMNQISEIYQKAGWKLLLNSHEYIVNSAHDSIALIGVENWSKSARFKSKGNIYQAMRSVPDSMFKVLLSHDPSHWEMLMSRSIGMDLTLSGHTHGMQFAFITNHIKISPVSLLQKYWAGLYHQNINNRNCYLYVNTGLGTVSYPSRFGVPPEITEITLKATN